ncbi:uncharacterized protein TEOVI_000526900 [Trypanosoma equiperdum]|uniref:FYVE-type domain-containing protein n=1 Tax=Trypanosoma equiperdum TaxID=5694 RepID=A0A1G4I9Y3_TRYEQ|nr:hypothetical protein, conserved [Trypanosoma equiperdum]
MTGNSHCVLCKRSFGILLWKHKCAKCNRNVCDDCAPKVSGVRKCEECSAVKPADSSAKTPANQPRVQGSEENPVLEAAMRRRQQHMLGVGPNTVNSEEKIRLLTEITTILKQRGEDEPFGLRSMDETKLRVYLRHIREKYGITAVKQS